MQGQGQGLPPCSPAFFPTAWLGDCPNLALLWTHPLSPGGEGRGESEPPPPTHTLATMPPAGVCTVQGGSPWQGLFSQMPGIPPPIARLCNHPSPALIPGLAPQLSPHMAERPDLVQGQGSENFPAGMQGRKPRCGGKSLCHGGLPMLYGLHLGEPRAGGSFPSTGQPSCVLSTMWAWERRGFSASAL